ncbi:SIS domain-containing protein [Nocardiopsis sp. CNT312]|uniref:SIS domain-containing protein n=1 Tax=Nocardiopsis sp. CNT312 TaxID=1137268 RepID=UPI000491D0F3|nr:SIS domain-containing protein [Nocardiopsis sp. CNT312]
MSTLHFDRHVAEQPDTVRRLLTDPEVPALDPGRPIVFTGIGTSLHAAQIAAGWVEALTHGRVRASAVNAHDLAVTSAVQPTDQVVVISHRGTKRYPNMVLRKASEVGAATVCITGVGQAEPEANLVLRTCPQEKASTHTVSHTAALTVLARLVGALLEDAASELIDALRDVPGQLERALAFRPSAAAVDALVRDEGVPALIAGTGTDAITAQEVALKLKEGTYRWVEGMHTEFALHGTPAVFRPGMSAFLIAPSGEDGGRYEDLSGFLGKLGARVLRCADDDHADLRFARTHPLMRPIVATLPFHLLVSEVAREVGSSPDLTHFEAEAWKAAFSQVTL